MGRADERSIRPFAWRCAPALSLLLASAAWHKLRDVGAFRAAVENYRLLPPRLGGARSRAFADRRRVRAGGRAVAAARRCGGAALGGAALLALYAAAMAITLRRGRRDVDCGCAGPAHRQSVRPALVARNGVLVLAALTGGAAGGRAAARPGSTRSR